MYKVVCVLAFIIFLVTIGKADWFNFSKYEAILCGFHSKHIVLYQKGNTDPYYAFDGRASFSFTCPRNSAQVHAAPRLIKIKMTEQPKKRFAQFSMDEIVAKSTKTTPKATLQANEKASRLMAQYLAEKGDQNNDYHTISPGALNDILKSFYLEARTTKGEL